MMKSIRVPGINSGKYAYNNVQLFVTTWYHKLNRNWHMFTEAYYEYDAICRLSQDLGTKQNQLTLAMDMILKY